MDYVMKTLLIKNLVILQSPYIYNMVKDIFDSANKKGINIGELDINPYIYNTRGFDIVYLKSYFTSLNNLAEVLRNLYDRYIYELNLSGQYQYDLYQYDLFYISFNAANNVLNAKLISQYDLEDFGIYHSDVSISVCMHIYTDFMRSLYLTFSSSFDSIKKIATDYTAKYIPYIYDKIFEQFEPMYLPFY